MYTEEKFEDEEDMRERARCLVKEGAFSGHAQSRSDCEVALRDLVQLAKQHGKLYHKMVEILSILLQRDLSM